MSFVVTIDGPAAAGKSTTARAVAERLQWTYLDTGAFYRALALKSLRSRTEFSDAAASALARGTRIEFSGDPGHPHLLLDGEDVTEAIRTPEVSESASQVAAFPGVRSILVDWQRELRAHGPLVGEGRDLGTVVFPDAEVKVFLDADLVTRAARRHEELRARGITLGSEVVMADLRARDERDRSRRDSPLRQAEDAVVVDTSGMGVDEQVEAVLQVIRAHPAFPGAASGQGAS